MIRSTNSNFVIYFVQVQNYIKIGFTETKYLKNRIANYQTSSPFPIQLLSVIPGGEQEELLLHQKFWHLHHNGEWFRAEEEIFQHLNSIQDNLLLPPKQNIKLQKRKSPTEKTKQAIHHYQSSLFSLLQKGKVSSEEIRNLNGLENNYARYLLKCLVEEGKVIERKYHGSKFYELNQ